MADAKLGILISADPNQAIAGLNKLNSSLGVVATGTEKTSAAVTSLQARVQAFGGVLPLLTNQLGGANKAVQGIQPAAAAAATAVSSLQTKVKAFGSGVSASIPAAVSAFNKIPASVKPAVDALNKLPSTSNQATQSMMNLSRVAQDAPYGFIGIANNLNPLLESFQRLKASTGSTGGALKALGSSLTGAGGIGLALGVVSSLAVVFGDKLFGASKAAKEAKEANDELAKSASQDIAKLTAFVAVASNVNAKQSDRVAALKEINEQYGKYLPSLDKEAVTLKNIGEAYDVIVNGLLRQAVAKGLQDEIAKEIQKTASALIALEKTAARNPEILPDIKKTTDGLKANTQAVNKDSLNREAAIAGYQRYNRVVRDGVIAQNDAAAATQKALNTNNTYEVNRKRLEDQLKKSLEGSFKILQNFTAPELDITPDRVNVDSKVDDKIIARAKKLLGEFGDGAVRLTLLPQFSELDTKQEALKKAKQIISDVESFFKDFSAKDRKLNVAIPFSFEIDEPPIPKESKYVTEFGEMFKKELQEYFNAPIKVDFSIDAAVKKYDRQKSIGAFFGIKFDSKDNPLTEFEKSAIVAAQTIQDIMVPAFQGLFDAILQGESPIKAFFQSLGRAVSQLIQKLISAAITAAILSAVFPGGFGGVKGFGSIFGNLLGFAEGGRPPTDKPSVIGERGREIFIPDRPGVIIPNRLTEKILNGPLSGKLFGGAKKEGGSLIGKLFGGNRQDGGSVFPGLFYNTGEAGRELFIPKLLSLFNSQPLANIERIDYGRIGTSSHVGLQPALNNLQRIDLHARLSGNDILLSNNRTGRSNNRNV